MGFGKTGVRVRASYLLLSLYAMISCDADT